ncbi:raffinose/stachyose/melibiose transport system permease protein [Microbacterium sp. W4I4]|uniref:carbohydrate ABC transporter permease n=1 Tax=Microbacterium sp. W4I4 TaxID=3042295 RepID=UPI0027829492|nr:sugar ABC transporter permease [Microbacterium sp. W4I4]MDQ0615635.1 raffinose/stachyose/melibiose transport system permease protein [Microbacterium sp. W4I4]
MQNHVRSDGSLAVGAPSDRARRHGLHRAKRRESLIAVCFLLPALAFLALFVAYPLVNAGTLSFFKWDGFSPREWIGLGNFLRLAEDGVFWSSLKNNVLIALAAIVFQVALGMVIAYWLVRVIPRFKRAAMFLYVIPVVISEICIGLLWQFVYNPYFGLLNGLLRLIGLDDLAQGWLGDKNFAMPAVLVVMNLTYLGLYILLFVAAFQDVDESVYEAAALDGAGHFRTFFGISVPMIFSNVQATVLLAVVTSFKTFSLVFVMTRGGPSNATDVVSTYLFKTGFGNFEAGYASAIGIAQLVLTVIVGVFVLTATRPRQPRRGREVLR